jgi:plastocyanin
MDWHGALARGIAGLTLTGLFACGGGSPAPSNATPAAPTVQTPTTPPDTPAAGVTIVPGARTLGSQAYSPSPLTVNAGTTVTWTNGDTSTHGAVNDAGVFISGNVGAGGKYSITLQVAGTYAYHCPIHSSMTGTIVVR